MHDDKQRGLKTATQLTLLNPLPLVDLRDAPQRVAGDLSDACRAHGFFYIVGHGIDESLGQRLEALRHRFFALPESSKAH